MDHLVLVVVVEFGLGQFLGTELDSLPIDARHILFIPVVVLEVLDIALVDVQSLLLQTG